MTEQKVVIIDTGCANVSSVKFAIERLGYDVTISKDPQVVLAADKLFLPGVGTASEAMKNLEERDLISLVKQVEKPLLGICLGMQVALIEYARNVAGLEGANSTEFDSNSAHPVVGLITEWLDKDGNVEVRDEESDLGGTMRLGAQLCHLKEGSKVREVYGSDQIVERHRHRYEVNNNFVAKLEQAGLSFTGLSEDKKLVEIIENKDHPWFIAAQFHPEFTSTPRDGHPLFEGFVAAAHSYQKQSS